MVAVVAAVVAAASGEVRAGSAASTPISACVTDATGALAVLSDSTGYDSGTVCKDSGYHTLTWQPTLSVSAAATIEQDLGLIQQSVKHLAGAISAVPGQQTQQRRAFLRIRKRFEAASTVTKQIGALDEMSNQTSLALQEAMDRQSKLLAALSNLDKKIADTESTLESNLK